MARRTKRIPQRNKFIILTNGKQSEKNYFELLRGSYKSIFDVKVEFENSDPIGLINRAIREKDATNQVWVVFDKDDFPEDNVYSAMRLANKNNVGVAFSNEAFEVWLINHFKSFNLEKTRDELNATLDKLLKDAGYAQGYDKSDKYVLSNIMLPRLEDAMLNSDVALQKRIANSDSYRLSSGLYPYCDWNSCTTVHFLIEALVIQHNEG